MHGYPFTYQLRAEVRDLTPFAIQATSACKMPANVLHAHCTLHGAFACTVAELREYDPAQAAAASTKKEAAATASAAEERIKEAETAAATLHSRLGQKGAELASTVSAAQETANVQCQLCTSYHKVSRSSNSCSGTRNLT